VTLELASIADRGKLFITGSISPLGSWSHDDAVALSDSGYTESNPLWTATVELPAGTEIEYKFIKKRGSDVTWESDPNRSYTVPTGCDGDKATVTGTWR
jgi:hypothetical protein